MQPNESGPAALARARALVLRWGWNATAYQILNPGFELWFSSEGDAVAGVITRHRVRVVGGAPVCAEERLASVAAELEADASAAGERVCYFAAEARLQAVLGGSRAHSAALLGAQPVWNPADWAGIIEQHASLRAQLNRARNKGVEVSRWASERAAGHPGLQRCLKEWLETRGLPPLHFLVEPETLERLWDRRVFVAEREGVPIAYLVASPIPARRGWLVEQWVRGRAAPNGTAELMVDAAMRALAEEGAEYVTLGLAPLSRHAHAPAGEPAWLRAMLAWMRAHGKRFYNFEGLDRFKAKLDPREWEPIYAIAGEPHLHPSTLYAVGAAFSAGSPLALLARGVSRAVMMELRRLT